MMDTLNNSKPYTVILIHNHLGSSMPSFSDLMIANIIKYKYGLIACHNGDITKYKIIDKLELNEVVYMSWLEQFENDIETLNNKLRNRGVQIWKL